MFLTLEGLVAPAACRPVVSPLVHVGGGRVAVLSSATAPVHAVPEGGRGEGVLWYFNASQKVLKQEVSLIGEPEADDVTLRTSW